MTLNCIHLASRVKGRLTRACAVKRKEFFPPQKFLIPPSIPLCPRWREVEGGYRNDSCQPPFTGKTAVKCDDDIYIYIYTCF